MPVSTNLPPSLPPPRPTPAAHSSRSHGPSSLSPGSVREVKGAAVTSSFAARVYIQNNLLCQEMELEVGRKKLEQYQEDRKMCLGLFRCCCCCCCFSLWFLLLSFSEIMVQPEYRPSGPTDRKAHPWLSSKPKRMFQTSLHGR